jgi:putative endonuclease
MKVSLYVLQGILTGKRYVGITNDLERRLSEHRSKRSKGGQNIGGSRLLHTEVFPNYSLAREREKFLKSGRGRKWLDELDKRTQPAGGGERLAVAGLPA